jgi:hypothetical protein
LLLQPKETVGQTLGPCTELFVPTQEWMPVRGKVSQSLSLLDRHTTSLTCAHPSPTFTSFPSMHTGPALTPAPPQDRQAPSFMKLLHFQNHCRQSTPSCFPLMLPRTIPIPMWHFQPPNILRQSHLPSSKVSRG